MNQTLERKLRVVIMVHDVHFFLDAGLEVVKNRQRIFLVRKQNKEKS